MAEMTAGGWASVAGTAISMYGQYASARAAKAEGELTQRSADLEAGQMRRRAKQAFAAGQRQAQDELRNAKLMQSRALMLAAAGGGGASDPSIVNLIAGIADEGAKRASLHMQAARQESGALRLQAISTQYGGANARDAAGVRAAGYRGKMVETAASGAGGIFSKYSSGDKPNSSTGQASGYSFPSGAKF